MQFVSTAIRGAFEIRLDEISDERGFFARVFCQREFVALGLNAKLAQSSISFNRRRGTLRGLHFQSPPHEESKLVRCTAGAIFDVILDLRPQSTTFGKWHGVELSARNHKMVYVPEGCAHGLLTLADETEVHYHISEFHHPESARGVRWNDPAFRIEWPMAIQVVSERDQSYADFSM